MFAIFQVKAQQPTLKIESHKKINQKIIDSIGYEKNFKSLNELHQEIKNFNKKLNKIGFLDFKTDIKQINSLHIYTVDLKNQIKTLKIHIPRNTLELLSDTYKKTIEIPFEETENLLTQINEEISNNGKPFTSLKLKNLKRKKDSIEATLTINSSKERQLDKITVKGYEEFPKSYLKNFLRLKTGKKFNKKNIDKKLENLDELKFAKSIREPEVLFTKDSTTLYLYLEKQNSNTFDGFLGFSNEENSNNLKLNGYINVNLNNNLNFGESLNIEYKNNGEEYSYFYTNAKIPFIFNSPISPEASLSITNQDSTFTTNQQNIGLNFQISANLNLKASYSSENSNFLQDKNTNLITNNQDYTANFGNINFTYQERSKYNIFRYNSNATLNLSLGERSTASNKNKQQKISIDIEKIISINHRNHIYLANHSGFINSDNYLDNELFRTGGIKTLRGFQENSLIGELYSFFNTEYRYLLDENLYANSIFDFGNIRNQNQNVNYNVYSIGFGLGLETKSGLLKLIFANGKTEEQSFKFQNTKVHLSLTVDF
ncbi:POTRA domain-containing protein [Mesonia sp.]|uniref:POTRA domain-containing protein n=1 Tax=Mesonia sp. TaxID=1960830 RepID=UPI001756D046|nr:POTRA domain-containing protein [Mesonia sp.]HIB37027.1 hypothetical protein [Mesonia sp.]